MNKFIIRDKNKVKAWIKNILKFTAPALAVLFAQLASGVNWQSASLVAILAFYGLLADYFKKLKE